MYPIALRFLLTLVGSCWLWTAAGAGYFAYHERARLIYERITELRLAEATTLIAQLQKDEPDNLAAVHLANYVDFFTVYVSEDVQTYRRLKVNRELRLKRLADGDTQSPYLLYSQAEIRLHWALLKFRFEDYLSAFTDINRAHKLLLKNEARFPHFIGNKKDLGILHAAVGTVPDNYRWALELISSLEGTVEQGKREVEMVLRDGAAADFPFMQETQVLYSFLLLHLDGRPKAAWAALEDAQLRPKETPLHAFVLANVAMRTGRNEAAIRWLSAAPRDQRFFPIPFLDYMLGVAKLRRLDPSAKRHLLSFLAATKGRHYIKEAHQKMGWAALLEGRPLEYRRQMRLVTQKGTDAAGGDRNALREATAGKIPQLDLLRARLRYDGGYYQEGLDLLNGLTFSTLTDATNQLEYTYRKGRLLQGLERYDAALAQFNTTIATGAENPAFFACNAALQAGLVEEKRRRYPAAKRYFQRCLAIHPDEYRTGLHQQAKAGLSRLR
ncbi:MAG: hypothetical protein AAGJ82_08165 [Bacteroidota bacterium]